MYILCLTCKHFVENKESHVCKLSRMTKIYKLEDNFKYLCDYCDAKFCFPTMFQDHLNLHSNNKPYICECRRRFCTLFHLSSHERSCKIVQKEGWKCTKCKSQFTDQSMYRKHIIKHNQTDASGLCSICGKYSRCVRNHMKKCHTAEMEYKHVCEICGKKFPVKEYLKVHKEKHQNDRFLCQICGKSYKFSTGLRLHKIAEHTNISCEYCSERMTNAEYKKHQKICGKSQGRLSFERKRKRGIAVAARRDEDNIL